MVDTVLTKEDSRMTKTIICTDCGWTTDIETTSNANPHVCPKCQGAIVDAGTGEPVVVESSDSED